MAKKIFPKALSVGLSLALCASMVAPALAVTYDVAEGVVHIEKDDSKGVYSYQAKEEGNTDRVYTSDDSEIIITGRYSERSDNENGANDYSKQGSVIDVGKNVTDTTVTLKDVNIDVHYTFGPIQPGHGVTKGTAAMSIDAGSNVTVELEGNNILKSGDDRAGLELNGGACVTIQDAVKSANGTPGSLDASAGMGGGLGALGAGIGSGNHGVAGDITITAGANVTVTTSDGAGIGSGSGNGSTVGNITINGGATVTAKDIGNGAGIGAGQGGHAGNITISGEGTTVTAEKCGTGIGSARWGEVNDITIKDGATVESGIPYSSGTGIGAGEEGTAGNITITGEGTNVTAVGGVSSAGIGTDRLGEVENITISDGANVTASTGGSWYGLGAGIGTGCMGTVGDIKIENAGSVTATGGKYGAGIGAGEGLINQWFHDPSTVGQVIIIGNSDLTVKGGSEAVNIGAGASDSATGNIEVRSNDKDGNLIYIHHPADGERVEYLVTPANGSAVQVDETDYTVEIPAGSTVVDKDNNKMNLPHGGSIDAEGVLTPGKHTPDKTVRENEVPAQVNRAGSYEEVVYCSCGEELSRKTKTIEALREPFVPAGPGGTEIDDPLVPLAAGPVTRAEFLDYLWRHEGEPASDGVCTFTDVPEDHEFILALAWAEQNGVASAEGDGVFEPDELVTVAAVREFLDNFARVFGTNAVAAADLASLTGEEDEAVLNCDEVLAEFFGEEYVPAKAEEDIAA